MCGWFAGQFSRDNRRDIYMQWTDLHSSLKLVNSLVFSRLHLLRRRGTSFEHRTAVATCLLVSGLKQLVAVLVKNPYLQYQSGLSRDCAIICSIGRVCWQKCARLGRVTINRAHHPWRIPQPTPVLLACNCTGPASSQDKIIGRNSLCSFCRSPRDGQDAGNGKETFLLESYDSRSKTVRPGLSSLPTEKGSSLKTGGKLMPLEIPERKWEHVVIDFVVGLPVQEGCDTIFTVVDKATKMCHFIPCNERISAKQVAYLYWSQVGKLHGIPKVLISDRDVRFTSKFWKSLWNILGTNIRMGLGFHPQSSGQVEIFNKLLEQTLRCTIHQLEETRNWVKVLPAIEFAVNNSANRTTGFSAFYLNYGYHPLHPVQIMHSPEESSVEAVTQFASRLQEDFTVATRHLQQARDQMIKQTEPHKHAVQFQEGDQVLLSTRNFRFKHCPTKCKGDMLDLLLLLRESVLWPIALDYLTVGVCTLCFTYPC